MWKLLAVRAAVAALTMPVTALAGGEAGAGVEAKFLMVINEPGTYRLGADLVVTDAHTTAICVVARETGNQFEWQTHAPLAIKAGVPAQAIDALAAGRRPRDLSVSEACAVEFASELMLRHGVSDASYAEAISCFGQPGTVELTALVGYFVMVCWIMNVARTPGPSGASTPGLAAFPG